MAQSKDWKRAFFAAIGGACSDPEMINEVDIVQFAVRVANEAEAMIDHLDAEILVERARQAEAAEATKGEHGA